MRMEEDVHYHMQYLLNGLDGRWVDVVASTPFIVLLLQLIGPAPQRFGSNAIAELFSSEIKTFSLKFLADLKAPLCRPMRVPKDVR